ncbi:MAG: PEP-CTERM sorting domain-containing protein [Sodalinema sp.]|uniref:PEP-CTERM sorting domain-containing protein n=1 Tax=Sodalinema sp. TaxID=3080550 RepID=UPI001224496A|nr:MAG: PEP-CTERM sorting domain-containing protein [Phormidium sp. SL48-SHIP]
MELKINRLTLGTLGLVLLSGLPQPPVAEAATIHQTVNTLPSGDMFEAFDSRLGSLERVVFSYEIRFDSIWSPVSGCQSQGGWHDCTVAWDFDLNGVQGFDGLSDDLGGVFTVDELNQTESRTFSGRVSFDNLNDFLGRPGDRVGGLFGTLNQGNIGYIRYPVINDESVLKSLNWFVQNTLSYDYQPHARTLNPDSTQVPEPSLLLGLMTLAGVAWRSRAKSS